ncbi:MAG: undecaprenyldiphospho-muramoylpentapeptide beta-N-acetylglucosaminyltransferase [Anaerovibrio sp.]|uniref:undecaprenyldiphospho-muramoylpentapeptide beta-N-acetylglucosaminyltransferase n=1 Tax=Anaerovibrio sp. TaxID=1872532 RepID=UPI0025CDA6F5|nr:undecaprenyldiphospho-muramoylpentapeptide beta-N-acetylglucosaminyltransferase [Anaerovibrio sp.]MCR5175401.1 undecaprenyldiphospho-muramoylpentapeptide beta-N-acetylglucosaminyltransferase [Anaerovibrio sp.]
MRIIVSGGGTGGHIYPAITIIRMLKKRIDNLEILYVGTSTGLEADIVPKEGLPFKTVDLQGFKRSLSPVNLIRVLKAVRGVFKAAGIVRSYKPDVVIGTGGYVCGPVLMAASLMGIPTLIQEQNVVPGITNKILSHFVSRIATGAIEANKFFPQDKVVFTGNPIRDEVINTERRPGYEAFGLDPEKKTLLVSGGSRGARSINRAMVGVLKHFAGSQVVQILHATGKGEYDDILQRIADAGVDLNKWNNIKVFPYLYNMPQAMAVADLAVFRAGATGLAELTAKGIPAVLIPYPYAAENHQEFNARAVEKAGAAQVILNSDLNSDILIAAIEKMLFNNQVLHDMSVASRSLGRPEAAGVIADIIMELANKKKN